MPDNKITLSNGVEYNIPQIPLGKYGEILRAFPQVAEFIKGWDTDKSEIELIQDLGTLIATATTEYANAVEIATKGNIRARLFEDTLSLKDGIDVATKIFEVNQFSALYERAKKVLPAGMLDRLQALGRPLEEASTSSDGSTPSLTSSPVSTDGENKKSSN